MIKGYGFTLVRANSGEVFVLRPSGITLKLSRQVRKVYGYPYNNPSGNLQIVDVAATRKEWQLTLDNESFDRHTIELVMEQFFNANSTITLPTSQEVAIADNHTATVDGLVAGGGSVGYIEKVDGSSIRLSEGGAVAPLVYTVGANGLCTFDEGYAAGTRVIVAFNRTYTAQRYTGGPDAQTFDSVSFQGRMIGPRFSGGLPFYVPSMIAVDDVEVGGDRTRLNYLARLLPGFTESIIFAGA